MSEWQRKLVEYGNLYNAEQPQKGIQGIGISGQSNKFGVCHNLIYQQETDAMFMGAGTYNEEGNVGCGHVITVPAFTNECWSLLVKSCAESLPTEKELVLFLHPGSNISGITIVIGVFKDGKFYHILGDYNNKGLIETHIPNVMFWWRFPTELHFTPTVLLNDCKN